jgi:hypothetical protein
MSTDLPDLAHVRAALADQVRPVLPESWLIEPAIKDQANAVVPVLYFEFTEISGDVDGRPLGRGTVACHIAMWIVTVGTSEGAEDDVDAHMLALAYALQSFDDLHWERAVKDRTKGGQLGWRVSLVKLATDTPNPEPAPEPDEPEE